MAYNDLFDEIDNCMAVSSIGVMRQTVAAPGGGVVNTAMYAVGAIEVSIEIDDCWIVSTAAPAGANTMTIQTNIAGGGLNALTTAIVLAAAEDLGRTADIVQAQATVGPADLVNALHAADDVGGIVHLLFHLT